MKKKNRNQIDFFEAVREAQNSILEFEPKVQEVRNSVLDNETYKIMHFFPVSVYIEFGSVFGRFRLQRFNVRVVRCSKF